MSVLTDTLTNPPLYTAYLQLKNTGGAVIGRVAVLLLEQDTAFDMNDVVTAMRDGVAAASLPVVHSAAAQREDISYTTL
jgi:hypothetical protein